MHFSELNERHFVSFIHYLQDIEPRPEYSSVHDKKTYQELLVRLHDFKEGHNLPVGYMPSTSFFYFDETEQILGRLNFRHELNEQLLIEGGHIGYEVRRSIRGKGIATEMLSSFLRQLPSRGVSKVLITCFEGNVASEKVILKNRGVFESTAISPRNGKTAKRYWIDLGANLQEVQPKTATPVT